MNAVCCSPLIIELLQIDLAYRRKETQMLGGAYRMLTLYSRRRRLPLLPKEDDGSTAEEATSRGG